MGRALVIFRTLIVRRAEQGDVCRSRGEEVSDRLPPAPSAPARSPRTPWDLPNGRDLLAGVALLAVLIAILVVIRAEVPRQARAGSAEPLAYPGADALAAAAPPPSWEGVPLSASPDDLGAVGAAVADGVAAARSRIQRCLAHERRRAGSGWAGAGREVADADLVLRLVARGRAVHVEGLEVRSGGTSPALVACARRLLDGGTFPADDVVPGRRHRLALQLP